MSHWLWFVVAVLVIGPVIGFVGLAVVSTPAGQYALVAAVCAIVTYWTKLANDHHNPV